MTNKLEIYKCNICGNIVQVLAEGGGALVCCGKEMELQNIQFDTNELGEKHSPKIENREDKKFVHVKTHPMTNEHYIQFIQVQTKDKNEILTKFFNPEEIPEIDISNYSYDINAIEYCNIHHLWGMKNN